MGLNTFVSDAWSWLNYKPMMAATSDGRPHRGLAPQATWLPQESVRRLTACKVLAAYDANQAGELAALTGNDAGAERREFGDARYGCEGHAPGSRAPMPRRSHASE
ncbi:hypothetical protein HET69_05330 [Streptomyces sp. CJ_13]|uniref:hypothetical protein n=1 Tax=Streptomyces TaxID=1883 RepID=UPI001BDC8762|nr:hypothetical protein [Streptomyces sp. CJ_13]MBT1183441.1 hypothetical protein [Streptomyces sp. CJ_13]